MSKKSIAWLGAREQNIYGLAVLPAGVVLGAALPNDGKLAGASLWGGVAGGIVCFFLMVLVVYRLLFLLKKKDVYISFKGEYPLVGTMALGMVVAGVEITRILNSLLSIEGIATHVVRTVLPSTLAIFFILVPGLLASANRFRPVIAAVFSLVGGGIVLWVGINLFSLALLPNSYTIIVLVEGLIICSMSLLLLMNNHWSVILGVIIVIFSIVSLIGAPAGVLGGSLAVAWQQKRIPAPVQGAKEQQVSSSI